MNNFSLTATQRKLNKQGRPLNFHSTDVSRFAVTETSKTSAVQSRPITQMSEMSQASFPSDPSKSLDDVTRLEIENYFDDILEKITVLPFHIAVEPILTSIYTAYRSILWMTKGSSSSFYSPTLDKFMNGEDTLVAASARARTSIICPASYDSIDCGGNESETIDETNENSETIESDPSNSKLFFPFYLKTGTVIAVAEVIRAESQECFEDHDLKIAAFLMRKFLLYGSAVFNPAETVSFASEFAHISTPLDVNHRLATSLIRGFNCKLTDFWCHHNNSRDLLKFDVETGEFVQLSRSLIGVVTAAIRNKTTVNSKTARYHPNFSFNGDPLPDEPVLISTYEVDDCVFAAALRGRIISSPFSPDDESKLEAVMPFIARSLLYSTNVGVKGAPVRDPFEMQLTDLLDTAALFATQLTFEDLAKTIQEKSARLVKAKYCRLLIYDHMTNQLVSDFDQSGRPQTVFSATAGLVGAAASFGSVLRVSNPMADVRFDEAADLGKLNEIDTMLIVPIFSALESVVGVLALANKANRSEFTEEDEKIIITIAVFASISLQNAKIFQMSLNLTQQLNKFVYFTHDRTRLHSEDPFLIKILKKARDESKAYRVTLFLCRSSDRSLLLYRSIGGPPEDNVKFSLPAAQKNETISYPINSDDSDGPSKQPTQHTTARPSETGSQPISGRGHVNAGTSPSPSDIGRLICCTPICEGDEVLGVLEICIPSIGTPEDVDICESFCKIAVLTILQKTAKELREIRNEQFALIEMVPESERDALTVPSAFKSVPDNIFTNEFDITRVESKDLMNIAFAIFDKFGMMHEFKLSAGKLFLFIFRIQNKNGDDWRHALEVTSFLAYLLLLTRFDEQLKKHELLSLIIASLCHDIDAAFFPTSFAMRADTALDVLFSKQPVFESHSCSETVSIVSSPEIQLFETIDEERVDQSFEIIIKLILATDYYRHYELMHELKVLLGSEQLAVGDADSRLLIMEMLLKCADVGVIARAPKIADKYKESVCEEFFKRGPIERPKDMVYTSNITKNRSHLDKERSRAAVLDTVFAPMFRIFLRAYPQFEKIVQNVADNVGRWTGNSGGEKTDAAKQGSISQNENESTTEYNADSKDTSAVENTEAKAAAGPGLGPDRMMEAD